MIHTGMIIQERYCILECREQGEGFRLFLAEDLEEEKRCLVKVSRHSLRREARLLEQFSHPLLPTYVDCLVQEEDSILVLEERRGTFLSRQLAEGGGLDAAEVREIFEGLLDLLAYLHEQTPSVYCPYLSPENLLYEEGELTLIRLGETTTGQTEDLRILEKGISQMLKRKLIPDPVLGMFRLRCRIKNGRFAFESPRKALEVYQRVKKMDVGKYGILCMAGLALAAGIGMFFLYKPPFEKAFGRMTEKYWEQGLSGMTPQERKELCRELREDLEKLVKTYGEEKDFLEEQEEALRILDGQAEGEVPEDLSGKLMRALSVLDAKRLEKRLQVCALETEFEGTSLRISSDGVRYVLSIRCDGRERAAGWDGERLQETVEAGTHRLRVLYIRETEADRLSLEG